MLLIFALCYLWLILTALAFLTSGQDPGLLAQVLVVGAVAALPVGLISGCALWIVVAKLLPAWLTTLVLWALAALPYALLAWWTGEPKTIEKMLVVQACAAAGIWPIALAGVIRGLLIEGVLIVALMTVVYSSATAIKIAGSHLTAKLRMLVEIARYLGL